MKPADLQDRPTYILSYPRALRLARMAVLALLTGSALIHWGLAWARFLEPAIHTAGQGADLLDALSVQPLRPLVSAHVSLVLVAWALAFVCAFLPDLSLADSGLAVRTISGWRVAPWASVTAVRSATVKRWALAGAPAGLVARLGGEAVSVASM